MNKLLMVLSLATLLAFGGCATTGDSRAEAPDGSDVPSWYLTPPGDGLCGAGAMKFRGTLSMAKRGAEGNARTAFSRALETKVGELFKSYNEEGGTLEGDWSRERIQAASRQLTVSVQRGLVQQDAKSMGGQFFMLMCLKPGALGDAISQMNDLGAKAKEALRRDAAAADAELKEAMGQ